MELKETITYFICGMIAGGVITLIVYSILVAKRVQEEQDKATKCIFKYEEYRRRIRTLEYQKMELEKKLEVNEHDGCMGCVYEDFEEFEEPCAYCKGTYKHDTMAYLKAKDCYVRKVDTKKE